MARVISRWASLIGAIVISAVGVITRHEWVRIWVMSPQGERTPDPTRDIARRVRQQLQSSYRAWSDAEKRGDVSGYLSFVAPDFTAVGQEGNRFDRASLEVFAKDNARTLTLLSQIYRIDSLALYNDSAVVFVHHTVSARLRADDARSAVDSGQIARVAEIMRQTWVRRDSTWLVKDWDDVAGQLWLDGKLQQSWSPRRRAVPIPSRRQLSNSRDTLSYP